jgi:hypothetical protein
MAKSRKIASAKTPKLDNRGDAGEVEVVAQKKGMGWEGALAIFTTLILIAACLCVDYDLGHKFGQGMFFK